MIYVCDAIMGAGKSSAAIHHMNNSTDKFMYCTPYLTEVTRVREACASRNFCEPKETTEGKGGKRFSLQRYMSNAENVVTTHQLFAKAGGGVFRSAEDNGYVLIIDESYDVVQDLDVNSRDLEAAMNVGLIEERDGNLLWVDDDYTKGLFSPLKQMLEEYRVVTDLNGEYSCWVYPPETFACFRDIYILTYLFEGSLMQSYIEAYNMPYQRIGVHAVGDHYEFFDGKTEMPEYTKYISGKIHINEEPRLNEIGNQTNALSKGWYIRNSGGKGKVHDLMNRTRTFNRRCGGRSDMKMWVTFKGYEEAVKSAHLGKDNFVPIGMRATNKYADKRDLSFLVNVFCNPYTKLALSRLNMTVDDNLYALSSLVQWVWRSRIRNGEDINLFLPSSRMRGLFNGWLDSFA